MILTPLQKKKQELLQACTTARLGDWFERYINHARGLGNTDALIYACKQRGATLIVATTAQADEIHEVHKIKTVPVHDNGFAITPTRSVVDNHAILQLIKENRKLVIFSEELLTIMNQKGID